MVATTSVVVTKWDAFTGIGDVTITVIASWVGITMAGNTIGAKCRVRMKSRSEKLPWIAMVFTSDRVAFSHEAHEGHSTGKREWNH